MEKDSFDFQLCQKLVIVDEALAHVLLAQRKWEADYDGVYGFIGGKAENTDIDYLEALQREKIEEIGDQCAVELYYAFSVNHFYRKNDGRAMILPHYFGIYRGGDITLSDEYSHYERVPLSDIDQFQPLIETVPGAVFWLLSIKDQLFAWPSLTI